MANRKEEFDRLGVDIIAISMSKPATLGPYLKMRRLAVPIFADPERAAYRSIGLGRTTVLRLFRPKVVLKYLWTMLKGWRVRRIPEGEDALQLGGDFLIAADRRLLWEYRSTSPTDRPSVKALLKVASARR